MSTTGNARADAAESDQGTVALWQGWLAEGLPSAKMAIKSVPTTGASSLETALHEASALPKAT